MPSCLGQLLVWFSSQLKMHRSFDPEVMKEAAGEYNGPSFPYQKWVDNTKNVMLVDGDDVGLATFEYKGVYTVHWFYVSRGRAAIKMAREMLNLMFQDYGAEAIRGLTPTKIKSARWLARQVGCTSYGFETFPSGENEIFIMTKQEFEKVNK